jgi:hypothetical protein
MNEGSLALMIPITAIISISVVMGLAYLFRFRARKEIQDTVRAAIDHGQELSPDLIEGLMESLTPPHADLRRGIISIAIGIATFMFSALIGEEDAEGPLRAIAMFPMLIGVAYLGLWFFVGRKKKPAGVQ